MAKACLIQIQLLLYVQAVVRRDSEVKGTTQQSYIGKYKGIVQATSGQKNGSNKEKAFCSISSEALKRVTQSCSESPILADIQGQVGPGSEHLIYLWVSTGHITGKLV